MAGAPFTPRIVLKRLLTASASFDSRNFGSLAWSAVSSLADTLAGGTDGLSIPSFLLKISAHVSAPPASQITAWVRVRVGVRARIRVRVRVRVYRVRVRV